MAGQENGSELVGDAGVCDSVSSSFPSRGPRPASANRYRSFIGTICLMTVPLESMGQKVGLVICYYITLSFWSAQTLALSMVSRNIAGQTKKSVVVALNFVIWSAGNAIGKEAPDPPA